MRMIRIRIHPTGRLVLVALLAAGLTVPAAGESPSELVTASGTDAASGDLSTVVIEATSTSGPAVSPAGANQYGASAEDIAAAPRGRTAPLTDVLAQMPGVRGVVQHQPAHALRQQCRDQRLLVLQAMARVDDHQV